MNVLIAFERSGVVREAFRALGHNAYSNDLEPADDGSPWHFQCDATEAMKYRFKSAFFGTVKKWDLIVMHPVCQYLSVSGNAHYGKGRPQHHKRVKAIAETLALFDMAKANADRVALENPVGVLPVKADQYVQPWQFGDPESKKTGFWLHNLIPLEPTDILPEPTCGYWRNQTPSGQNKLGPSPDRARLRAVTYKGIARAMAHQWGNPNRC